MPPSVCRLTVVTLDEEVRPAPAPGKRDPHCETSAPPPQARRSTGHRRTRNRKPGSCASLQDPGAQRVRLIIHQVA
jgi:hypothetical protein